MEPIVLRHVAVSLLLAMAVAGCGGGAVPSVAEGEAAATAGTGDLLPAAELARLDGNGALSTVELRGVPTVVNFWATWCAFCVDEMPDLEVAHQRLADDVRVVGVDREDPQRDRALALARETGVTYELVVDHDGSFFRAVRGRGMPTTLLVDADGVIRHRHAGPLTADQLLDLVAEHLGVAVPEA